MSAAEASWEVLAPWGVWRVEIARESVVWVKKRAALISCEGDNRNSPDKKDKTR